MTPLWTSHRGLCNNADENTRSAFEQACTAGFESFETDLRMTSDGHIVLCHDVSFERLGGPATPVHQMSRSKIATLKLKNGHSPFFFDEFIEMLAGFRWIFDIKPETGAGVIHAIATWLQEVGSHEWFLSHSRFLVWKKSHAALIKNQISGAELLPREGECWRAGLAALFHLPFGSGIKAGRTYAIPPTLAGYSLYQPRYLDYYRSRGAKLVAYLPEAKMETQLAVDLGFDEILTNHPIL